MLSRTNSRDINCIGKRINNVTGNDKTIVILSPSSMKALHLKNDFPFKLDVPWLQRPVEKINIPGNLKQKARDGPLVAGGEKFVSISSNRDKLCPSSLIGSSDERTTVIGLRNALFLQPT